MNDNYIAFSLPTGIGAKIGGFAGDIGHIVRQFSQYFKVIVNPNAVNGGILSAINSNMFYTEGFAFDEFLCGNLNLLPVNEQNKIGVIFDCAIPKDVLNVHLNTISAARVVWGASILEPFFTDEQVGVDFEIKNNMSSGILKNPNTLLSACKKAIENGANALAVVCFFGEDADNEAYSNGIGIDPIGGVEAVISHLVVKEFNVPCAHAPAFLDIDISKNIENEKVASECISSTYLPCILQGLSYAPQFVKQGGLSYKNVSHLVVPNGALGSKGVLGAIQNGIQICAVKNSSKLNVGFNKLKTGDILQFESYNLCLKYLKEFKNGKEKL